MKLKFNNVTQKDVGKKLTTTVIDNLSFELQQGEHLSFLTKDDTKQKYLMRLMLGTLKPSSGVIVREGSMSSPVGDHSAFHKDMTTRENIHFFCELYGRSSRNIIRETNDYIEGSSNLKDKFKVLNLNEKKKIAMTLSLLLKLDIYVIKSGTGHPDKAFKERFDNDFLSLLGSSATAITMSTNITFVKKIFHRSIVLENSGSISEFPSLEEGIIRYKETNPQEKP